MSDYTTRATGRAGMAFAAAVMGMFLMRTAPAGAEDTARPVGADFIGAEVCLTCHADKESFKKNIHGRAWPAAKGIEFTKSCETCHGPGSLHAGAAGDKADPGFKTILNPGKAGGVQGAETCLKCHAGEKNRLFWEGSAHDDKRVGCASCHSVHGNADKLLAQEGQNALCMSCHRDVKTALMKRSKHPLRDSAAKDGQGAMACADCHNPHGSQSEKLVRGKSVNDTCYACHAEKKAPVMWEHGPVKEDCTICHTPHGSSNDKLLVTKVPRLCQQCHMQGRHQTGALATNSVFAAQRGCLNCHPMIHGSNSPSGPVLQR